MRDRKDFIENIQAVHTHLLICLEDIKYPLPTTYQEGLECMERVAGAIIRRLIEEDIEKIKAEEEARND